VQERSVAQLQATKGCTPLTFRNGHSDGTPLAFWNGHSDGTPLAFWNGHSDGTPSIGRVANPTYSVTGDYIAELRKNH